MAETQDKPNVMVQLDMHGISQIALDRIIAESYVPFRFPSSMISEEEQRFRDFVVETVWEYHGREQRITGGPSPRHQIGVGKLMDMAFSGANEKTPIFLFILANWHDAVEAAVEAKHANSQSQLEQLRQDGYATLKKRVQDYVNSNRLSLGFREHLFRCAHYLEVAAEMLTRYSETRRFQESLDSLVQRGGWAIVGVRSADRGYNNADYRSRPREFFLTTPEIDDRIKEWNEGRDLSYFKINIEAGLKTSLFTSIKREFYARRRSNLWYEPFIPLLTYGKDGSFLKVVEGAVNKLNSFMLFAARYALEDSIERQIEQYARGEAQPAEGPVLTNELIFRLKDIIEKNRDTGAFEEITLPYDTKGNVYEGIQLIHGLHERLSEMHFDTQKAAAYQADPRQIFFDTLALRVLSEKYIADKNFRIRGITGPNLNPTYSGPLTIL